MYPTMSVWCDKSWLSLDHDDITALQVAYPPLSGGGGTSPTNTAPSVTITAPASGLSITTTHTVTFSGTANDTQDGNLSGSLRWVSNLSGQIGTGASFSRSLPEGVHTIAAVATDSGGMTSSQQVVVTVAASGGTPTNTAPSVAIAAPASGSTFEATSAITFSGTATDTHDGNLSGSLRWVSNLSGQIGTGASFSRTLPAGVHTIAAVATDSAGLTSSQQVVVTVTSSTSPSPPPPSGATLTASGYKVRGVQNADLRWSGLSATSVTISRNGSPIGTMFNSGAYTDVLNVKGGGSYTYRVCAAGTSTCTNSASVTF
jgi:hypothetical protein